MENSINRSVKGFMFFIAAITALCAGMFIFTINSHAAGGEIKYTTTYSMDEANVKDIAENVNINQAFTVGPISEAKMAKVYMFKPTTTGFYKIHTTGSATTDDKFHIRSRNTGKGGSVYYTYEEGSSYAKDTGVSYLQALLTADTTYIILATNNKSTDPYNLIIEPEDSITLSSSDTLSQYKENYKGKKYIYGKYTANEEAYYKFESNLSSDDAYCHLYVPCDDGNYHEVSSYTSSDPEYVYLKKGETCYVYIRLFNDTDSITSTIKKLNLITNIEVKSKNPYCYQFNASVNKVGVLATVTFSDGTTKDIELKANGTTSIDGFRFVTGPVDRNELSNITTSKECHWKVEVGRKDIISGDGDYYSSFNMFEDDPLACPVASQEFTLEVIPANEYVATANLPELVVDQPQEIKSGDRLLFTPQETDAYKFFFTHPEDFSNDYEMDYYVYRKNSDGSYSYQAPERVNYKFTAGTTYLIMIDYTRAISMTVSKVPGISNVKVLDTPKYVMDYIYEGDGYNTMSYEITYANNTKETLTKEDIPWSKYDYEDGDYRTIRDRFGNQIWAIFDDEHFDVYDSSPGTYSFKLYWTGGSSSTSYSLQLVTIGDAVTNKAELNKAYQTENLSKDIYEKDTYFRITGAADGNHLIYHSINTDITVYDAATNANLCSYVSKNPVVLNLSKNKDYVVKYTSYRKQSEKKGVFVFSYFGGETNPSIATDPNAVPADWEKQVDVNALIEKINALPETITLNDKKTVQSALKEYNGIKASQIAELDNATKTALENAKAKLDAASARISELEEEAADEKAVKKVKDLIDKIPNNLTMADKNTVTAARAAYNSLPDELKKEVGDKLTVLEAAEAQIAAFEKAANSPTQNPPAATQPQTGTPSTAITVAKKKISLKKGASYKLTYILTPVNSTDKVTFSSSNPKAATVSADGKIKAKGKGTTTIKAVTTSGKSVTIKVTVAKKATGSKSIKVKKKMTMKAGDVKYISYTRKPAKATDIVTFKSSKKSVVSVDSNGKLIAKKKGKATITIKAGKKKAKCVIKVN